MWIWIWKIQIHPKKVGSRNTDLWSKTPLWTSFVKRVGSEKWPGSRSRSSPDPDLPQKVGSRNTDFLSKTTSLNKLFQEGCHVKNLCNMPKSFKKDLQWRSPPWTSFVKKVAMSKTFVTCQGASRRPFWQCFKKYNLLEQALSRRLPWKKPLWQLHWRPFWHDELHCRHFD